MFNLYIVSNPIPDNPVKNALGMVTTSSSINESGIDTISIALMKETDPCDGTKIKESKSEVTLIENSLNRKVWFEFLNVKLFISTKSSVNTVNGAERRSWVELDSG